MLPLINKVEQAIQALRAGKMIILTDSTSRENEGDLIVAAEKITDEQMNFMIRQGTGIVCLSMPKEQIDALNIPMMVNENTSQRGTPFTVSIDAKYGITTGVSASDRVTSIHAAVADDATPASIVMPGHIFPLRAEEGGVLTRDGHTEGAVDLVSLAGLKPAAVLCEVMNADGTMATGEHLKQFAAEHALIMISIDELIEYRLEHEDLIADTASCSISLAEHGEFELTVFKEKGHHKEHVLLHKPSSAPNPLVRVHSSCFTGDIFASNRCDCHQQLHYSLEQISQVGGCLIYLSQEGRDIGLFNKIKAYALQDAGFDTVDANVELGLPIDSRKYYLAAHILKRLGISDFRLLTNNPAKIKDLNKIGSFKIERVPMPSFHHAENLFYLETKCNKLNHAIQFILK